MSSHEQEDDLGFSESEIVVAWAELISAGVSDKDIRGGALAATLSLAASADISTADSTRICLEAQKRFNLLAEQLPRVAHLYKSDS